MFTFGIFLLLRILSYCGRSTFGWFITIEQKDNTYLHVAEVQFFHGNHRIDATIFNFTASSYMSSIQINNFASGPPEAGNDGNRHTFFHSGFEDPKPLLNISTHDKQVVFDRIRIINRQDLDDMDNFFYGRLVGAQISVYDYKFDLVFRSHIKSALSSYNFFLSTPSNRYNKSGKKNSIEYEALDSTLFYGSMTPAMEEWYSVFPDNDIGIFHTWMRCNSNGTLRGYFYIESLRKVTPKSWAGADATDTSGDNFILTVGGTKTKMDHIISGGRFYHQLSNAIYYGNPTNNAKSVLIEVKNWTTYIDFPLRLCASQPKKKSIINNNHNHDREERVMHIYTFETDGGDGGSPATISSAIVRHAAYHRCLLNLTRYEIVANEEIFHIFSTSNDTTLKKLLKEGFIVLMTRPSQLNQLHERPAYWQIVYENLAVLNHWESDVRSWIFFFDPDEFLSIKDDAYAEVEQTLTTGDFEAIEFDRVSVKCKTCPRVEVEASFEDNIWKVAFEEYMGKVAVRTDIGGVPSIHYVNGKKVDSKLASSVLVHFPFFYGFGHSDNRKAAIRSDGRMFDITKLMQPMYVCDYLFPSLDYGEESSEK